MMPEFLGYLLIFVVVGAFFVFFHLVLGRLVRPIKPNPEKMTIYECGEPTIGSSWVQFDLRYYVVALLFIIFDVEVAFFFPWAAVFGKFNALADPRIAQTSDLTALPPEQRDAPEVVSSLQVRREMTQVLLPDYTELRRAPAAGLAWVACIDILIFFGVLLVGYIYLWRRGDLDWVKTVAAERAQEELAPRPPPEVTQPPLVGAGR
jgi:NADH-quinone oxidoreductase subunit A